MGFWVNIISIALSSLADHRPKLQPKDSRKSNFFMSGVRGQLQGRAIAESFQQS